jgi:Predicted xylanase/chitin deacetylase
MRVTSPVVLAAMLLCLVAILAAGRFGPLSEYVQQVKNGTPATIAFGNENSEETGQTELKEWLKTEAKKRYEAPVNATQDRVWKAIPGYNGREVDIDATFERAKAMGFRSGASGDSSFPWVYKELKPAVGLKDLQPSPIYRGNSLKPMVGLMINVAWGEEYLPSILQTLEEEKAKATFFFDGSWLSKHADIAQDILRRGHEASNHAYSHPNMSTLSAARQRQEIVKTENLLKTKLGVDNRWFAPPSGDYNQLTVDIAREMGLQTVLWTLDTVDWRKPSASSVIDKVSARAGAGTLILMHPTETTRDALKGMIRVIRSKGLTPGTVSDTLSEGRMKEEKKAP